MTGKGQKSWRLASSPRLFGNVKEKSRSPEGHRPFLIHSIAAKRSSRKPSRLEGLEGDEEAKKRRSCYTLTLIPCI